MLLVWVYTGGGGASCVETIGSVATAWVVVVVGARVAVVTGAALTATESVVVDTAGTGASNRVLLSVLGTTPLLAVPLVAVVGIAILLSLVAVLLFRMVPFWKFSR